MGRLRAPCAVIAHGGWREKVEGAGYYEVLELVAATCGGLEVPFEYLDSRKKHRGGRKGKEKHGGVGEDKKEADWTGASAYFVKPVQSRRTGVRYDTRAGLCEMLTKIRCCTCIVDFDCGGWPERECVGKPRILFLFSFV